MGVISFSQLPEEEIFETYDLAGFTKIVRSLDRYVGQSDEVFLSVYVGVEKEDLHDIEWHEVPGIHVYIYMSDAELDNCWRRVYTKMNQLHKPKLRLVG